jgi:hypothetical protein
MIDADKTMEILCRGEPYALARFARNHDALALLGKEQHSDCMVLFVSLEFFLSVVLFFPSISLASC